MIIFVLILKTIFGAFFMFAGIMHFIKPQFFKHFIPDFFPKLTVNYVVGIIEFALGLSLFFTQIAKEAGLGICILMILFVPIHIWDLTKERPAIGSKKMAVIRIPFQFVLIYCAYLIYLN
jgi:uncharacterized membrane protein